MLPDVLKNGLRVVFVGMAAGDRSAERQAYYAGQGNRFWQTLADIGLTQRLQPEEFYRLPEWGIGLTDIVKFAYGADRSLKPADYGVQAFLEKIRDCQPQFVAFNGKSAAAVCRGCRTGALPYGRQEFNVESAVAYVLPSTSGAAGRYWKESYWQELAAECNRGENK